jgi:hypothetical protein
MLYVLSLAIQRIRPRWVYDTFVSNLIFGLLGERSALRERKRNILGRHEHL